MTTIWCVDTTLKFIGLYEAESVIWNPNHAQYKDKIAVAEAWDRIANIMGAQVPDLKRKKEALMTSYRLMKKRQLKQGEEFITSWYAFRSMDNFLGHLYEKCKDGETNGDCSIPKTEKEDSECEQEDEQHEQEHEQTEDEVSLDNWADDSTILELATSSEPTESSSTNNISLWSNETTLKFLQYYQHESIIWNTNNPNHKSKPHLKEAWKRIAYHMDEKVVDLKRKKESLMSRYRVLKRSKESLGDAYVVSWFAYDYMDSFLGYLYPVRKLNSKSQENAKNTRQAVYIEEHLELSSPEPSSPQSDSSHLNLSSNGDQVLKRSSTNGLDEDECELFGRLLAKKLRRYSLHQQLELMHKIDGLLLPTRDVLN